MRLLLPVILGLFAACGSPSTGDTADAKTDSTAATMDTIGVVSDNELSASEKSSGWELLFDGKTKTGWHGYHKGSDAGWKAENGTLALDSVADKNGKRIGVDIVTDGEYENFDFKADWKISEGGNSGIMFGVNESPKYEYDYYTGPEMQVLDNDKHDDGKIIKHRAGDLYDLITSKPETVKPVGEWNSVEIIKNNGTLEFKLNGTTVVNTTIGDDAWKKLVAGSKFKQWPDFGTFKSGHFALQDHGAKVWYRNIKIKKL